MLERLDVVSAQVLGDRWREADFRQAVAADAAQINPAWTAPARPSGPPQWVQDPAAVRVPVTLWHGKHETATTLSQVTTLAGDRTGVDGPADPRQLGDPRFLDRDPGRRGPLVPGRRGGLTR